MKGRGRIASRLFAERGAPSRTPAHDPEPKIRVKYSTN